MSAAVISGWTAVSPYGIGRKAFEAGFQTGADPLADLGPEWDGADTRAGLVPRFDIRGVLGKKGTRSMDRVTALSVCAVSDFVTAGEGAEGVADALDTALVLGTTTGSGQSMMDFTRASLVGEKPFYVDPALMPNAVMNCAAGQCAIWHQLKGPNTTIAGGRAAGLFALGYARRLLATRRAGRVLCGCAEEYSRARSWLEHHARGGEPGTLAEGSVMLLVEPPESAAAARRPALAEILAVESRVDTGGDEWSAVTACVSGALQRAGVEPSEVWAALPGGGEHERGHLGELFGLAALDRAAGTETFGDAGAATAGFQIAAVLAAAAPDPSAAGRAALVTAGDGEGSVVCAVLRLLDGTP